MTEAPQRVRVARVARAHGLEGELALELLGGDPERLPPGSLVVVAGRELEVKASRRAGRHLLCRLGEVEDRMGAERLVGEYLEVPLERARPLPPGEYFHFQLVGLKVEDETGAQRGELVEVEAYPANDIYLVRTDHGDVAVPAVRAAVLEIDLSSGRMRVASRFLEAWADAG